MSIGAVMHREDFDYATAKTRILLVGRSPAAAQAIAQALEWFYASQDASLQEDFVISAVPNFLPDGARPPSAVFPPAGVAYSDPHAPEAQYLWRWIGMHAPDLVVEVQAGEPPGWFVPAGAGLPQAKLMELLMPQIQGQDHELAAALVKESACETGRIAAVRANESIDNGSPFLPQLLKALRSAGHRGPSPARRELQQRLDRTPVEIAQQLSRHYGKALPQVVYIPAMALVGRLRLGELTSDPSHLADVRQMVAPYDEGAKQTQPDNGSALSGHLIFSELAARTEGPARERYLQLARNAADLAFGEGGRPNESMPFHSEMSDALFMGGPILAHVGRLSGDPRYFEACVRHLRFMRKLVLRDDGLYRHSPLDDAAWGRGNGFPALGLALCLTHWPAADESPNSSIAAGRAELLTMFRNHMAALQPHQDQTGCWRQIVDRQDSYCELSCTCMICFAAARGVREGWLERDEYDPMIRRAWNAIRARAAPNGRLVDVCTGTGKQKSLDDYYRRPALLGLDDRGGAMALLAATEMASYVEPK
jgi:rhamnogalacturonyl hydrolase YesR